VIDFPFPERAHMVGVKRVTRCVAWGYVARGGRSAGLR